MAFFTEDQITALSQKEVRLEFLCELQFTSDTAYIWNGEYNLSSGGRTWKPLHGIGRIEGLGLSSDATSEQITISLSGLPDGDPNILALALEQTPEANQQLAKIYIQFFDVEWQPIGDPVLIWFGAMQPPRVSRTTGDDLEGPTQSITVAVENYFYNRSRAPYGRNTDRDQQNRYPGDKFFQFTPSLLSKSFTYPDF